MAANLDVNEPLRHQARGEEGGATKKLLRKLGLGGLALVFVAGSFMLSSVKNDESSAATTKLIEQKVQVKDMPFANAGEARALLMNAMAQMKDEPRKEADRELQEDVPSVAPTLSNAPSVSHAPSVSSAPSVSAMPTLRRVGDFDLSEAPSLPPSIGPSSAPSVAPSTMPSVSLAPSVAPSEGPLQKYGTGYYVIWEYRDWGCESPEDVFYASCGGNGTITILDINTEEAILENHECTKMPDSNSTVMCPPPQGAGVVGLGCSTYGWVPEDLVLEITMPSKDLYCDGVIDGEPVQFGAAKMRTFVSTVCEDNLQDIMFDCSAEIKTGDTGFRYCEHFTNCSFRFTNPSSTPQWCTNVMPELSFNTSGITEITTQYQCITPL